MKGYKKPFSDFLYDKPVIEDILVGCRRCLNTWHESRSFMTGGRINGPLYDYDYCDECIIPGEAGAEEATKIYKQLIKDASKKIMSEQHEILKKLNDDDTGDDDNGNV